MRKFSAKNKILMLSVVWIILSGLMLAYFFNFLDISNQRALDSLARQKSDLVQLQAERESFKQAQADLDRLNKQPYQPGDFFSQDVSLVNEIKTLENLSQQRQVTMLLSGISGTVLTAPKAKTITPIVMVPYGISLNGSFPQVINFIESLENLPFITNVANVSVSAADKGQVSANLNAFLYLKK